MYLCIAIPKQTEYRPICGKPHLKRIAPRVMFTFKSVRNGKVSENYLSIEKKTNLLLVEQKAEGEQWPRYIRLTGQQVRGLKAMFFKGNFASSTRPINVFTLEGDRYTLCCRSENQVIRLTQEEMTNIFNYYERHKEHIAIFDRDFRSKR